ncbi:MAG TPA: hypothetical protein VGR50_05870 [Terriglobales bacterium]|nr:hypothetical protein [Terriglobales bacterium]
MPTQATALQSAYRAILQFLAGSVVVTDTEVRHHGAPPLCTEEETKFLVRMIQVANAKSLLDPADGEHLYLLFRRASSSPFLDMRNARHLFDSLPLLTEAVSAVSDSAGI